MDKHLIDIERINDRRPADHPFHTVRIMIIYVMMVTDGYDLRMPAGSGGGLFRECRIDTARPRWLARADIAKCTWMSRTAAVRRRARTLIL